VRCLDSSRTRVRVKPGRGNGPGKVGLASSRGKGRSGPQVPRGRRAPLRRRRRGHSC
jgi:hypothetical protein